MLAVASGKAQEVPLQRPNQLGPPAQRIGADSVRIGPARLDGRPAADSLPNRPIARSSNLDSITLSPDALEDQVDYSAQDSMYFDIKNKQIHLYGQAEVKFQTMTVTANYILIDWKENTMTAEGQRLPGGEWLGRPLFTEGEQKFNAGKVKYNFKTYKGIIYDSQTNQEGMNVIGERGKFFGVGKDTTKHNVIYNKNAIFSTCDLEHPHFGIRSNKQKIVQDKVAIVGPCNLIVGDIPTPLWLPFGFFPLKSGRRTGLIFPRNYEYSEAWGFGFENVGYYFPINDNMDLQLTSDIYLKGTVRLHAISNYKKRYKFNGRANLDFSYQRTEDAKGNISFAPAFGIQWNHSQDSKAHPYRTIGGNISLQTGNYQKNNRTDAAARLNSSLSSSMSYRQRFDKPFDFSAAFNHSQNTQTRVVNISFPTLSFQTQTLYPFKRKVKTGGEKWFERIQMRYSSEARNQFTATDTTLFQKSTLDSAKFGVRHNVTASTSFNLLKFFNFSPTTSYKEVWYFKTQDKTFDPTITYMPIDTIFNEEDSSEYTVVYDTTFGKIVTNEMWRFKPLRQYNAGISMSTKVFGTLLFKRGKVRGLRHVITPTMGFNYTPDYTNPDWGYFKEVQKDLRDDEKLAYSIFGNNRISGFDQPSTGGKQMALNYGFGNLFEAKVFSKRDSTLKNIKLFNSVNVTGSYNYAADSMRWSVVNIGGNTNFFNNLTSFRFGVVLDPYDFNRKTGLRINQLVKESSGKYLRLSTWNVNLSTNITVERLRDLIKGESTDKKVANQPTSRPRDGEPGTGTTVADVINEPQDFLSLFEDFGIQHNFTLGQKYYPKIGKDSIAVTTHTLSSRGSIQLTQNWTIHVGNFGYDFQSKKITYPDFQFARDLHCWEMGVSWQPQFGSYSFFIRVKPGKLDFINIPYGKRIQDTGGLGNRRF
jgi:LptD protein